MAATLKLIKELPKKARANATVDPKEHARKKFLDGVERQIKLAENPKYVTEKVSYKGGQKQTKKAPPRAWWKTLGDKTYVRIRYGNRPLELREGTVAVTTPNELVETLRLIHKEGASGKWDAALVKAASGRRRKKAGAQSTDA